MVADLEVPSPLRLAQALKRHGVARITEVVELLSLSQGYAEFLELVDRFIPDCREDVVGQASRGLQFQVFARNFEARYFPLVEDMDMWGYDIGYEEFSAAPPIRCFGISYEDLHEQQWDGPDTFLFFIAGKAVIRYESGLLDVWLEQLRDVGGFSSKTLKRAYQLHCSLGDLHYWLDGSRFEGVAVMAEWMAGNTGTVWLDYNPVDWGEIYDLNWSDAVVEELTVQWQKAEKLLADASNVRRWMDGQEEMGEVTETLDDRARQLLDFIEQQAGDLGPPPADPLNDTPEPRLLVETFGGEDD